MRRRWIAAALSLVTVVAGHFYNRRPYKGLLFLVLAFTLAWVPGYLTLLAWEAGEGVEILDVIQWNAWLTFGSYVALVILSAAASYVDATRTETPEGTLIRVTTSLVASFVGALYVAWVLLANYSPISDRTRTLSSESVDEELNFDKKFASTSERDVCLAQGCSEIKPAGQLPGDGAAITGRLLLAGRPLPGARIALMTAKGEVTGTATTDKSGDYSIEVPPGNHEIVMAKISTDEIDLWDYTPVTGYESTMEKRLEIGGYFYLPSQPLGFNLEAGDERHLLLEFNERPQLKELSFSGKGESDPEGFVLEWSEVEGAASYGVIISRVEEEDERTTSYYPIKRLMAQDNSLSLTAVVERAESEEEMAEYSVSILAFDEDGRFISESKGIDDRFRLPGKWKIANSIPTTGRCKSGKKD